MKPFPLCQCQRRPHVGNIVIPLWLCLLLTPIAMNHMGPFTNAALNTAGGDGSKSLCSPQKALQWNSMFGGVCKHKRSHILHKDKDACLFLHSQYIMKTLLKTPILHTVHIGPQLCVCGDPSGTHHTVKCQPGGELRKNGV